MLGYSGCMILEKDHKWHAWKEFLSITRDGKVFYYNDPERKIEKLIALSAPVAVRAIIRSIEPGLI